MKDFQQDPDLKTFFLGMLLDPRSETVPAPEYLKMGVDFLLESDDEDLQQEMADEERAEESLGEED